MRVYFVQATSGPIKIGQSEDPVGRLRDLQCANHEELVLLLHTALVDERDVHKKFKHLRIRGEWFKPDASLFAFIEELRAQEPTLPGVQATDNSRVAAAFTASGMRLVRLSMLTGITSSTLVKYFNNHPIHPADVFRLADVLRLSPVDIDPQLAESPEIYRELFTKKS